MPQLCSDVSWNDMLLDEETPRPAWQPLWHWLNGQGKSQLDHLALRVLRDLDEQAITYTVHGDADEERPWDLDALPYLLPVAEWQQLAAGLAQRARCLDRLLADCHGEQRCLSEGLLPGQYVFEHPAFLQACRGWSPPGGTYLHCYAADLVRSSDGRWRVLADRCQSPLGLGYALQNRFVVAGAQPDLYQQFGVRRLRAFFGQLDRSLQALATVADPNIVILASSVYGDNAFEQAFLARYLGYDLVGGNDLTVRDDRCYVKTHRGLRQVDVILRFVDDSWCDPLVFRADSLLGVPGLQRAAALGRVVLANALGSGLLDSPVIRPLVGPACRVLLGEEPLLDGLPSRWGATAGLFAPGAMIKETWNSLRSVPAAVDGLTLAQRQALAGRMEQHPAAWCADEALRPSTAPVWQGGVLRYLPLSLRMYLVRVGDDYQAMPGGLLRIAEQADLLHLGARHGGGSKDCWVVGADVEHQADTLPEMPPPPTPRQVPGLPSSRCDDLFWFGRHLERCEHLSRLVQAADELLDEQARGERAVMPTGLSRLAASYHMPLTGARQGDRCRVALRPDGQLAQVIGELIQVAGRIRHVLSFDLWMQVQRLRELTEPTMILESHLAAERLLLLCSALAGTVAENTVRDDAWRFLELGRRLQRADATVRMLSAAVDGGASRDDLEVVLRIADSRLTYRARHRARIEVGGVVDLVGYDENNPRALRFQVEVIGQLLAGLPPPAGGLAAVDAHFGSLLDRLREARAGMSQPWDPTRGLLQLVDLLHALGEAIDHSWFSHALPPAQVDRSRSWSLGAQA